MNKNCKIKADDTLMNMVMKLVEGNPGAITVVMEMIKQNSTIDTDSALGELGPLLSLDSCAIYGSRIWMLYKDACGENITKTLAVLRAVQLGLMTEDAMDTAIDNYGEGMPEDVLALVQERLPTFGV